MTKLKQAAMFFPRALLLFVSCFSTVLPLNTYAGPVTAPEPNSSHHRVSYLAKDLSVYRPYSPPSTHPDMVPGCQLIHSSMLVRHGSRYPLSIEQVSESLEQIHKLVKPTELSDQGKNILHAAERFNKWFKDHRGRAAQLAPHGFSEAKYLGERFAQAFKHQAVLKSETIYINTTSSGLARAEQTMGAFIGGVKERLSPIDVRIRHPISSDQAKQLLIPTDYSDQWKNKWRPYAEYLSQQKQQAFIEHPPASVAEMAHSIAPKLSTAKGAQLLENFTLLCAYQYVLGHHYDKFRVCRALAHWSDNNEWNKPIGKISQMAQWNGFYLIGNPVENNGLNQSLGRGMLGWFINTTKHKKNLSGDTPVADLLFGHDTSIALLLQAMNIPPVEGDNNERFKYWPGRRQIPMAANVQWQLFRCKGERKVRLLINERVKHFPIAGCADQELCSWKAVLSYYQKSNLINEKTGP